MRAVLMVAMAVIVAAVGASPARAAGALAIAPLRVDLGGRATNGTVTISNAGDAAVDCLASAQRWTQSEGRPLVLEPAPEVAVFPRSFTLQPGEKRTLRVGTLKATGDVERAYRLNVVQLPIEAKSGRPALQFTTRLSVPIFVSAAGPPASATPEAVSINNDGLAVMVRAVGARHAFVRQNQVSAYGADGSLVASTSVPGWYVLSGLVQRFDGTLPRGACHRIARVRLRTVDDSGAVVERLLIPNRVCSAAS